MSGWEGYEGWDDYLKLLHDEQAKFYRRADEAHERKNDQACRDWIRRAYQIGRRITLYVGESNE